MVRVTKKRAGFSVLFLICLIPFVFTTLAVATVSVYEFVELASAVAARKNERLYTRLILREIIDAFNIDAISNEVILDPYYSSQLLISSEIRETEFGALEIQLYSMNYLLSSFIADAQNFPPSKKSKFGEINVFIRAVRRTKGVLAYRTEAAVEFLENSSNVLWWREFVIN